MDEMYTDKMFETLAEMQELARAVGALDDPMIAQEFDELTSVVCDLADIEHEVSK